MLLARAWPSAPREGSLLCFVVATRGRTMDLEAAAVENARHCYRDSDSEQELVRDAYEFDEWQRQQQHAANDAMAAEAMEALAAEPVEEPVEPPPLADTAPSHGDVPTWPAEPQNSARAGKARRQYCCQTISRGRSSWRSSSLPRRRPSGSLSRPQSSWNTTSAQMRLAAGCHT